jgi:hypothetical protein
MAYDNTNRGALFRNDKREADTDANYNSSVNIQGTEYWLCGWLKTSRAGDKYISLSVRPKEASKKARTFCATNLAAVRTLLCSDLSGCLSKFFLCRLWAISAPHVSHRFLISLRDRWPMCA